MFRILEIIIVCFVAIFDIVHSLNKPVMYGIHVLSCIVMLLVPVEAIFLLP